MDSKQNKVIVLKWMNNSNKVHPSCYYSPQQMYELFRETNSQNNSLSKKSFICHLNTIIESDNYCIISKVKEFPNITFYVKVINTDTSSTNESNPICT